MLNAKITNTIADTLALSQMHAPDMVAAVACEAYSGSDVIRHDYITPFPGESQRDSSVGEKLIDQFRDVLDILCQRHFSSQKVRLRGWPWLVPTQAGKIVYRMADHQGCAL